MCDCGTDGTQRTPMASVVEACADLGVGTPTQYVARWTEVAVVARERGYLAPDSVVSFDDAGAVDAARAAIEGAVRAGIASEEDCGDTEAREKTAGLFAKLDRKRRAAGNSGKGKRRPVACPTPLREVLDGSIEHEERWNRCAELVADRGLSMKAAALLFATTMFCFTKDLVCTMTRAQLMSMTGIRTPASFAAAVRELMDQSLLSPKDGAPRTSWYLGEGFWGGLLAGEELDTPVATLARRRRAATGRDEARGAGGAENRTSETGRESRARATAPPRPPERGDAEGGAAADDVRSSTASATGIENRTSGRRGGKAKVTVAAFAAEELPQNPVGTRIAERLADYYGKRGEYRIARARLRGLAARIRADLEGSGTTGGHGHTDRRDPASVARSRCRWCNSPFDHPAARGDRGDGVCRAATPGVRAMARCRWAPSPTSSATAWGGARPGDVHSDRTLRLQSGRPRGLDLRPSKRCSGACGQPVSERPFGAVFRGREVRNTALARCAIQDRGGSAIATTQAKAKGNEKRKPKQPPPGRRAAEPHRPRNVWHQREGWGSCAQGDG